MAAGHTVELQLFLTVKVAALAPAAKVARRRKRTKEMDLDAMDAVVKCCCSFFFWWVRAMNEAWVEVGGMDGLVLLAFR
jgi:hypothetical protein